MDQVKWGIIGCGDVTEIKSGPAFNNVPHSSLVAVMRRDKEKLLDYVQRHQVPKWYTDAEELIRDPEINAIYVATPPSSHEAYVLASIAAGKPVYVEKPMSVDAASARRMTEEARRRDVKMVVAHYRRAQPLFQAIRKWVNEKVIGEPRYVRSEIRKRLLTLEELQDPKTAWRVDPSVAGGGLFNDLSPHQLDLMYYFFGKPAKSVGFAINQGGRYAAGDMVAGTVLFANGVMFSGTWNFSTSETPEVDLCEIVGDKGTIRFSFFTHQPVTITVNESAEKRTFDPIPHVQQPMIEQVVSYFRGAAPNPCPGEEAVSVMEMIDRFNAG